MEASRKTIEFDEPGTEGTEEPGEDMSAKLRMLGEVVESGVREQMRERPYVAIGAAFGLGYVLGGGLPKMAVRAVGGMAMRYAALEALRRVLPGLASDAD